MLTREQRIAGARAVWLQQARPGQRPPPGWDLLWLVRSGRGYGKTRIGAEETVWGAARASGTRWACVAATSDDAREVLAFGPSGLQAVLDRYSHALGFKCYEHEKSRTAFALWNGSRIRYLGAERPERLRGPNFHGGWADEVAAWRYPDTWDQLELSVRAPHPALTSARIVATTTPVPSALIKRLDAQADFVTEGSTYENAANLDPAFIAKLEGLYGGTRFGAQELHGTILRDIVGALFKPEWLRRGVYAEQEVGRVIVGVDPAGSHRPTSDETGIITAASKGEGFLVLSDRSGIYTPEQWASIAGHEAAKWGADLIVAERNYGGDMVKATLLNAKVPTRVKTVTASRGKAVRAEPIAALYEQGRIEHVEGLTDYEVQLTEWVPGIGDSPDRVDAAVWALSELSGRVLRPVQSFGT